ncbi:uncharacterized protein LOC132195079 isoform X3 [Neocloeon triangulifer]|nr:uncharacterized protein LOC132195079 isoform X3 [Neocloeon triangulifer]XP_059472801.1 uncharacterized protein LOC132195079 isoform X3 [Neocloeon triangulifer]
MALRQYLSVLEGAVSRIACRQTVHGFSPQSATLALHTECRVSIPSPLRQRLVDLVVASGRIYNTIDLLLLEVLMAPDIKRLCVRHVRKWYRERFLQLLKCRGGGLRMLSLEDIDVPRNALSSAFSALPSLSHLTLRFACDDATLWQVGKGCPVLQELDIEGSFRVTDLGIRALCLKGMPLPQAEEAKPEDGAFELGLWEKLWCCRAKEGFGDAVVGVSWWRASLMRRSRKNLCCSTLTLLNLISTNVSILTGVALIKNSCPNAKVLILREES